MIVIDAMSLIHRIACSKYAGAMGEDKRIILPNNENFVGCDLICRVCTGVVKVLPDLGVDGYSIRVVLPENCSRKLTKIFPV